MTDRARRLVSFSAAVLVGMLYAVLFCLVRSHLRTALLVSPLWILLFWFLFSQLRLLRFAGYLAAAPLAVLAFELWWSAHLPATAAEHFKTADRSHYVPNTCATNLNLRAVSPDRYGWELREVLIGPDGFRADPGTGQGNPEHCSVVLIGDSMIYGSGLPYSKTLAPVLKEMGVPAGVFGVTGNSPVDYLETLEYVADRIEPGAFVAIYLYAYNDFVTLRKYYGRRSLALAKRFPNLHRLIDSFDDWRQATFVYNVLHGDRERPGSKLWEYYTGGSEPIRLLSDQDPAAYVPPPPLSKDQKIALAFFLKRLEELARPHSWRVCLIILPDYPEIFANLARHAVGFADLDPRRAEVLEAVREFHFLGEDISRFLYARSIAESKSPYFVDDRHFSAFGTRVVAEHLVKLLKTNEPKKR